MSIAELACTYASLILHDDGQEITVCFLSAWVAPAGTSSPALTCALCVLCSGGQDQRSAEGCERVCGGVLAELVCQDTCV